MMKKIFLIGVILLFFTVNCFANEIIFTSPVEGQKFLSNGTVNLVLEADFEFGAVYIDAFCDGDSMVKHLINFSLPYGQKTNNYKTSVNLEGLGPGYCSLKTVLLNKYSGDLSLFEKEEINIYIFPPVVEDDSSVLVVRNVSDIVYPGSFQTIMLNVFLQKDFSGLVLSETIPGDVELKIINLADGKETMSLGKIYSGGSYDWKYEEDTRELKNVLMPGNFTKYATFEYKIFIPADAEPGTVYSLAGTWKILDEEGAIDGKQSMKVGGEKIPECPITDEELLDYIDQWENLELNEGILDNDEIMMQIIEVWKTC